MKPIRIGERENPLELRNARNTRKPYWQLHGTPLMIILVVYIQNITFLQSEGDTPITANLQRPSAFAVTFQFVQIQTW